MPARLIVLIYNRIPQDSQE